jgi:hypothetical protein
VFYVQAEKFHRFAYGGGMAMDEIVSQGARVRYHGSMPEYHGIDFMISATHPPAHSLAKYPGGVAYVLQELGGGTDGIRLTNVRRSSFEVISE